MTTTTDPDTSTPPESAPKPRSLRRRAMSRISIQSKLLVMLLVTSVLSAAVVGAIGYQSGRSSLRASVFDRLTEIREFTIAATGSEVRRPPGFLDHLHPRCDDHGSNPGIHRRIRPTQQRRDQSGAVAVDRRLLQQQLREGGAGANRQHRGRRRDIAEHQRPEIPAGVLHRSL